MGWNVLREQIFANQKRLGVIPPNTQLTPWPDTAEVGYARRRQQEALCAPGRGVRGLCRLHRPRDRPGDPGRAGSGQARQHADHLHQRRQRHERRGFHARHAVDMAAIQGINIPVKEQLKFYDAWGSPATTPHMSVAWAWAFETPFKWTKQVPRTSAAPGRGWRSPGPTASRTRAASAPVPPMIDIVPTILEAGHQGAGHGQRHCAEAIKGVSMAYTWDKANATAPSARTTQYFEMVGNRAIYHEGWYAATTPPEPPWLMGLAKMPDVVNGYKWELYNLADDYSQSNDLAAKMPDKLRQLQELFIVEASKYNVFPLDNSVSGAHWRRGRMPARGGTCSPIRGSARVWTRVRRAGHHREVVHHHRRGRGTPRRRRGYDHHAGRPLRRLRSLSAQGQAGVHLQFRGPRAVPWEGQAALTPGKHTIVFNFTYDGG